MLIAIAKFVLLFFVIFASITVNLPDGVIARIGLNPSYLFAALLAISITGLMLHRHLLLIVLVVFLSIASNMSESITSSWGVDRDYLFATLIAIVIVPLLNRSFQN